MSQFSQKYYKHYKIDKKLPDETPTEFEFWVWTRSYRVFEIIVILLLVLILFCLCRQSRGQTSLEQSVLYPNSPTAFVNQEVKDRQEESKSYTLGEKLPHFILPDIQDIIPQEMVTIQDYSYFIYDTNSGYPDFIDPATKRIIKEKQPKCVDKKCPLQNLSEENKKAYLQWLEKMSGKNLQIKDSPDGFKVLEKEKYNEPQNQDQ